MGSFEGAETCGLGLFLLSQLGHFNMGMALC